MPSTLTDTQRLLVEKIIRLQARLQTRKEKCEMLEETRKALVLEVQKKTKIIQNMALRESHGAITSAAVDMSKVRHQNILNIEPGGTGTF